MNFNNATGARLFSSLITSTLLSALALSSIACSSASPEARESNVNEAGEATGSFPVLHHDAAALQDAVTWNVFEQTGLPTRMVALDAAGHRTAEYAISMKPIEGSSDLSIRYESVFPEKGYVQLEGGTVVETTLAENARSNEVLTALLEDIGAAVAAPDATGATLRYGWLSCSAKYITALAACGVGGAACLTVVGCVLGAAACGTAGVDWACSCSDLRNSSACK